MLGDMTIRRMDNVSIIVEDLATAIAFFVELGLELEGEMPVEGRWVDLGAYQINGGRTSSS
jgi:catechol 2,3-dioxygenase-like lactoylglutathione lyase family enzyme